MHRRATSGGWGLKAGRGFLCSVPDWETGSGPVWAGSPSQSGPSIQLATPHPEQCKQSRWNSPLGAPLPAGICTVWGRGWRVGVCLPDLGAERAGRCLIRFVCVCVCIWSWKS